MLERGEKELNADVNRLVVAGDSAGGDAAIVVSMRLAQAKLRMPKLQVLVYPWVQKFFLRLPSSLRYAQTSVFRSSKSKLNKYGNWYLGVTNMTDELSRVYQNDELFGLIETDSERKFIIDCLDVNKIPDKFKLDKSFYETHTRFVFPERVPDDSVLRTDPQLASKLKKLLLPEVSPLLASKDLLARLPKTYMIALEWDSLKDDALLFAQRLKEAGVNTHVEFYTDAFHGMAIMTQPGLGYQKARDIQDDLLKYLQKNL